MEIHICISMQKHNMWMFLRASMKSVMFHAEDFPQHDRAMVAGMNEGRNKQRLTFFIFSLQSSCTDFRAPYCDSPNDSFSHNPHPTYSREEGVRNGRIEKKKIRE